MKLIDRIDGCVGLRVRIKGPPHAWPEWTGMLATIRRAEQPGVYGITLDNGQVWNGCTDDGIELANACRCDSLTLAQVGCQCGGE